MKKQLLASLLLLTLLLPFASAEEKTEAEQTLPMLELHQVNLGCADGYLIRFGNTTVLIDGGEAWPNKPERLSPPISGGGGRDACGCVHRHALAS